MKFSILNSKLLLSFLSRLVVALALIPVVALALIPVTVLVRGIKIALCLGGAYHLLMFVLILALISRPRPWIKEKDAIWQKWIAVSITFVCMLGMVIVFCLSANQQTMNWTTWPAKLYLLALIALILSVLSQIPSKKEPVLSQKEKERKKDKDINLALYTFYEGRVQTTKSILVGILTGILSLQIPIYLEVTNKKQPYLPLEDPIPIVLLFILSLPMFISMKLHMSENNVKSKKFLNLLPESRQYYNPTLPNRIYKARRVIPLELEWVFLGAIFYLAIHSIIFYKY